MRGFMVLMNARTGETVARDVELAFSRAARRRGLLGRDGLDMASALVLSSCWAIHTMFMRFAIDVIFVDREGRAVRIVRDLPPWRMTAAFGAQSAIEFAGGSLRFLDVRVGDALSVVHAAEP